MTKPTESTLDINELMARIRAEADRRRAELVRSEDGTGVVLPTLRVLPQPPTTGWRRTVDPKKNRMDEMLQRAREKNDGGAGTPKILRGLNRKQGGYNRLLLDAVGLLANSNFQLNKQVRELTESFDAQTRWLETLADHRRSDLGWMQAVAQSISRITSLATELQTARHRLTQLDGLEKRATAIESTTTVQSEQLTALEADLKTISLGLETVKDLEQRDSETRKQLETLTDGFDLKLKTIADDSRELEAKARKELAEMNGEMRGEVSRLAETSAQAHADLERIVARNEERQTNDSAFLKAQLSYSLRQKTKPAGRKSGPEKQDLDQAAPDESFDAFYLAFENRFRGSRGEVKNRFKAYLPFLSQSQVSGETGTLLDLGCGRGEWLELLKENNLKNCAGVDLNASMVEQCRERGLDATLGDCLTELRQRPDSGCELVTAFHLIEHLPFSYLMELLAEINRVLLPGGQILLETPNPRNILVGASDFYRDMTHRNPIHPDTIAFAVENVGFTRTEVYFLADEKEHRLAVPQNEFQFDELSAYIEVPRDFAVIARKA